MESSLKGKKIAILVTDGFEESEFVVPKERIVSEGAIVEVVSLKPGKVKSWTNGNWGKEFDTDITVADADANNFDALLLPGGVMNPDKLRMNADAVGFVTGFFDSGKPIGAICHGPWTLIETGELQGRKMTSYPSLKTDLINAGANWVDEEVVVDNGLVTSRKPADLPAFCDKIVEEFAEGIHEKSL